jgi:hypothetical protein
MTSLILLWITSNAFGASPTWNCSETDWLEPPKILDGVFRSKLSGLCLVSGGSPDRIKNLSRLIKVDIETSGKLQIHEGPIPTVYQGLSAAKYDVTDDLKSEGSPASIRQNLIFASDEKTKMIYHTNSTEVQGKGMASYLKSVELIAEVVPTLEPGVYQFKMTNQIEVERPWFAMPFIFEPIARNKALEKFKKAQEKLLAYLAPLLK